jgi:hypothetical protein
MPCGKRISVGTAGGSLIATANYERDFVTRFGTLRLR